MTPVVLRMGPAGTPGVVECRCTRMTELYGNDASQYAAGHLVRERTDDDELVAHYSCPDTGRRWQLDFPPDVPGGDPGDARLRQVA